MPIDPSIALGYRAPQVDVPIMNPVQQYATVMSLRDMMTRQQMNQAEIAKYQQDVADRQMKARNLQAFQNLYSGGKTPTPEDIYNAIGPDGTKVVQEMVANEKGRLENQGTHLSRLANYATTILNEEGGPKDLTYQYNVQQAMNNGDLPQDVGTEMLRHSVKDPQTLMQLRSFVGRTQDAKTQQELAYNAAHNANELLIQAADIGTKNQQNLREGFQTLTQSLPLITGLPKDQQAQGWADLLAKQSKPVRDYFTGYQWNPDVSPGTIALVGVKAEVGKTIPYPAAVQQQEIETEQGKELAKIAAENMRYQPIVQSVLAGKARLQDLPPDVQSKIAPGLIANGFTGFGKLISDAERERLGDYDRALTALGQAQTLVGKPDVRDKLGPFAGRLSLSPYATETRNVDNQLTTLKTQIKKFIANGSLRGVTADDIDKMFPVVTDTPTQAANKVTNLIGTLNQERGSYLRDLGDKVIPSGVAAGSAGAAAAPQQAPAAVKPPDAVRIQAMKAATPPNKVYVLRPDGRDGYINASDLDAALAKGYRRL